MSNQTPASLSIAEKEKKIFINIREVWKMGAVKELRNETVSNDLIDTQILESLHKKMLKVEFSLDGKLHKLPHINGGR